MKDLPVIVSTENAWNSFKSLTGGKRTFRNRSEDFFEGNFCFFLEFAFETYYSK